jgi:Flp pilus assembly protein TadG
MGVSMVLNNSHTRHPRGTTLLEAAIVLPLLILLIFGLIEYGSLLLRMQQIENVSRQAARTAATPDATLSQVNTLISTMMTSAGLQSSGYTVTMTPTDPATATTGAQISVRVQITYANIAIANIPLIPVPTTIARTVVMAKEGT